MDLKNFVDHPASDQVLSTLYTKVFQPTFKNLNVTLVSFRGAGKLSEIKYLLVNLVKSQGLPSDKVYFLFDLELSEDNLEAVYRNSLQFLSVETGFGLPATIRELVEELLAAEQITTEDLTTLHFTLTKKMGFNVTFIVDNFRYTFDSYPRSQEILNAFNALSAINPMKTSFVFLVDHEFSIEEYPGLHRISDKLLQNLVWVGDMLFDMESGERLIKNQEKWHDHKFLPEFKVKAIELSAGDPSVIKHIATKALGDSDFEKAFVEGKKVEELYNLIGEHWLDGRYKKIIAGLLDNSINSLAQENLESPTEYLLKTGLVREGESTRSVLNPLFHYFLVKYGNKLSDFSVISSGNSAAQIQPKAKEVLSAKELMVFNFLLKNKGMLVTREKLAQVMWGENWEDQYSDWAIDKIISNIRKKLEGESLEVTIKSLKGQGFMLV